MPRLLLKFSLKQHSFFEQQRATENRVKMLPLYNCDYDDEAIDRYWESMGEDGHTASEILRAYIDVRRENGEWKLLRDHPNLGGFLWEWLHMAQSCKRPPSTEELLALNNLTRNGRYEEQFLETCWTTLRPSCP